MVREEHVEKEYGRRSSTALATEFHKRNARGIDAPINVRPEEHLLSMWACCCVADATRYTTTGVEMLPPPKLNIMACRHEDGEIVIHPPRDAVPPLCAEWGGVSAEHLSADTLRACRLAPGRYVFQLRDRRGARTPRISVDVPSATVPTVIRYECASASGDTACDGEVGAIINNVMEDDRIELIWSTGERTTSRRLQGVRPGTYVGIVTRVNGMHVSCLHACEAARVRVTSADVHAPPRAL